MKKKQLRLYSYKKNEINYSKVDKDIIGKLSITYCLSNKWEKKLGTVETYLNNNLLSVTIN